MSHKSNKIRFLAQLQTELKQVALFTPRQVWNKYLEIEKVLKVFLDATRPQTPDWKDHRQVKAYRSYLLTQNCTMWSETDVAFLMKLVLASPSDDLRFHAAEALGGYISHQPIQIQDQYIHQLCDSVTPSQINTHVFETLYCAGMSTTPRSSHRLSEVFWWAVNIRNQTVSMDQLITFLHQHDQWTVDLLEYVGKYLPSRCWNNQQLIVLCKSMARAYGKNILQHRNWKVRAIGADLIRRGFIDTSLGSLYRLVKTDKEPNVRIRCRQALEALIVQRGNREVHKWVDRFLDDVTSAKESELRYIPHGLANLYRYASREDRMNIIHCLEYESINNSTPYNRKTALKNIAFIRKQYRLREDADHIIASLQDESLIVQDEALVSIKKRIHIDILSYLQAKKLLSNLQLHDKDWYFISLVYEVVRLIAQCHFKWTNVDTKSSVLLLPGTFDPFHVGHLQMAIKAYQKTNREVWIIPNQILKSKNPAPYEVRRSLILKLIADHSHIYLAPEKILSNNGYNRYTDDHQGQVTLFSPFVSRVGLLRGSDVLERTKYQTPRHGLKNIYHVLVCRDTNVKTLEKLMKKFAVRGIALDRVSSVRSTEIRKLLYQKKFNKLKHYLPGRGIKLLQKVRWYQKHMIVYNFA